MTAEESTDFFETHKGRVAHEVRALLAGWHARTETVRNDDDSFHRVPDVRNSFLESGHCANSCCASVSEQEMLCESIRLSL